MPSGQKPSGEHVRVRTDLRLRWIWEHVSADRHVVCASPTFDSREDCETDAKRQGLPLVGCRKEPRTAAEITKHARVGADGSLWLIDKDARGVWGWRSFDSGGNEICRSRCGFLSSAECLADAGKQGFDILGNAASAAASL